MKNHIVSGNEIVRLIDDFIGRPTVLFVPFCPMTFCPYTILSNDILSVYHFVHTILCVPFCPLPFVLEPGKGTSATSNRALKSSLVSSVESRRKSTMHVSHCGPYLLLAVDRHFTVVCA